jgi:hypothetical protein
MGMSFNMKLVWKCFDSQGLTGTLDQDVTCRTSGEDPFSKPWDVIRKGSWTVAPGRQGTSTRFDEVNLGAIRFEQTGHDTGRVNDKWFIEYTFFGLVIGGSYTIDRDSLSLQIADKTVTLHIRTVASENARVEPEEITLPVALRATFWDGEFVKYPFTGSCKEMAFSVEKQGVTDVSTGKSYPRGCWHNACR